jgi:hypothetical protein
MRIKCGWQKLFTKIFENLMVVLDLKNWESIYAHLARYIRMTLIEQVFETDINKTFQNDDEERYEFVISMKIHNPN